MNTTRRTNNTVKNTRVQGQILAILSETILTACHCVDGVRVYVDQADMKIESIESPRENVVTATVYVESTMICTNWNNPIHNSVEAKVRLQRNRPGQPWRLQYVVIIFPGLHNGKRPLVYLMPDPGGVQLEELLNDRSKFHREYPEGPAIDRSADSADLLRRSQLILGEKVTPWEQLHPRIPTEPTGASEPTASPSKYAPVRKRSFREWLFSRSK